MTICKILQDHIKMYGWYHTVLMVLKSVTHRLMCFTWQRFILFEQDITVNQEFGFDFSKYDIRRLTMADFENDLWEPSFLNAEKRAVYSQRFANPKDECYGVFVAGELACIGWNHYGELFVYGKFQISTDKKSSYLYDDFCISKYRRQGLHKIVNAYRKYIAAKRGVEKVYVAIATYNRPSLNNYRKGGFKEIQRFTITECRKNVCCSLKSVKG